MTVAPQPAMCFEDFRVGQRFVSPPRVVTADDIRRFGELCGDRAAIHSDAAYARTLGFDGPLAHGPLGIGIAFGLLHELGIVATTAIAMRDVDWRFLAPILAGDELRLELTVTRCRPRPARDAGLVHRHLRLVNAADTVVQEGTSGFLVRARSPQGGDVPAAATDFASGPWAALLRPRLERHEAFAAATLGFDGTIGLQCGDETVLLRIYKGRILESAPSLPHGATFTVAGSELAWVELALAPRNDFIARATQGAFGVTGDAYEYLRMTKAVIAVWDTIRELAQDGAA